MKFLTRFLLPLVITLGAVLFALQYESASPSIRYVAWPVVMLTIPLVFSAFIYLFRVVFPHSLATDFRFWHWPSYGRLADEMFGYDNDKLGDQPRNLLMFFIAAWPFVAVLSGFIIEKRYFNRHMQKYAVSTRGVVLRYIPWETGKYGHPARVDVLFITRTGERKVYRMPPPKEYKAGDSVTINYSTADPAVCEIDAGQQRLY